MNVENGDLGLGQGGQVIDGIVFSQSGSEFLFGQTISGAGFVEAGITSEITDGINSGDTRYRGRVFNGPVVKHQAAPAPRQEAGLWGQAAVLGEFLVKRGEDGCLLYTSDAADE